MTEDSQHHSNSRNFPLVWGHRSRALAVMLLVVFMPYWETKILVIELERDFLKT